MSLPRVLVAVHKSFVTNIRSAVTEAGAAAECVEGLSDVIGLLYEGSYSAIILQVSGGEGAADFRRVQAFVAAAKGAPLILLVDKADFQLAREALRSGVADVLTVPDELRELASALKLLLEQAADEARRATSGVRSRGRIHAVYSAKGGAGTTLLASNLALALAAATQRRVALLDLNLQFGGVEGVLNLTPERSFTDLLPVLSELSEVHLRNVSVAHPSGLSVFCAPARLAAPQLFENEQTQALLLGLRAFFDHVVIDCPSAIFPATEAALKLADQVLYILTPDSLALRSLKVAMDQWEQATLVDRRRVFLVLNRTSPNSEIEAKDVTDVTGLPILGNVRASFAAIQPLLNVGQPLISQAKAASDLPIARDLKNLALRLAKV